MSGDAPHKIVSIPELLEMILLQTDPRTLLVSAQRVCSSWKKLIKDSRGLQYALFFEPSKEKHASGQRGTTNPFLDRIWHEFFRRKRPTTPRYFLPLDAARENAYLREEASWRRMLIQQPPTYRMGIIELMRDSAQNESPTFTQIKIHMDRSGLRLGHLWDKQAASSILASRDTRILWERPDYLNRNERQQHAERAMATSQYLVDCDVVVFCWNCWILNRNRRKQNPVSDLGQWLYSAERWDELKGRYRVAIWEKDKEE